jgi:mono/diheme cytochrome c family protein
MRRAFALTLLFALSPATAGAEGDAQKGREIAVQHCGRCHVVPDYNPMGGIGSEPPTNLPAALQPFEMTTADLEDLLAYARQLREWQE